MLHEYSNPFLNLCEDELLGLGVGYARCSNSGTVRWRCVRPIDLVGPYGQSILVVQVFNGFWCKLALQDAFCGVAEYNLDSLSKL